MTFKEFFNKSDNMPLSSKIRSMVVVKDYLKDGDRPEFFKSQKVRIPKPHIPRQPTSLMNPYRKPLSQRPIENKPTDFLARKSNNFNK